MSTSSQEFTAQTTGRSVVVFSDDVRGDRVAIAAALRSLAQVSSVVATTDSDDGALHADALATADAMTFDALGVAVVARAPGELAEALAAAQETSGAVIAVEPEHVLHAIVVEQPEAAAGFSDDDAFTWGLRATGVDASNATGEGIKIAVLDSGIDAGHPDFAGRSITTRSFVTGATPDDGHGHGTHCAGTASGPAEPGEGRRYGVAPGAILFVGKVLDDAGSGTDASILAGIDWAITNGCRIISMSLGADVRTVSTAYETVGRRALAAGALIVAAAGNNANRRSGDRGFVGIPANSPSIMAVAAVDSELQVANFSAASNPVAGGAVDIAAPGVDVYSAWPMPRRTNTISGTSQATPHVAGIAALWLQVSGETADALRATVLGAARRLDLAASDVGAGLVQAPDPAPS
ncbi:MAG TPA: S8 family serine peptidase [Solirubrobacteraceae bacterium]|jgi:subtilisin family serine protease|nr:S8 family serine peptidase [Solirubrobacteraceae bacterium]